MALYTIKAGMEPELHISLNGNSKIGKGIASFSTLPGNEDHLLKLKDGTVLTEVPGTCSKHCEECFDGGCYAVNSARMYHTSVIPAWMENTLLLRSGKLFGALDDYLTKINKKFLKTGKPEDVRLSTFRINVSGELTSVEDFDNWNELAKKHPEIQFAVYTKNYEDLETFLETRGETEPNFVINVSQWHGCADDFLTRHAGKINVFEYDDTNRKDCTMPDPERARVRNLPHCPAVLENGKHAKDASGEPITCDRCKRCYRKTGKTTAVWSH